MEGPASETGPERPKPPASSIPSERAPLIPDYEFNKSAKATIPPRTIATRYTGLAIAVFVYRYRQISTMKKNADLPPLVQDVLAWVTSPDTQAALETHVLQPLLQRIFR